MSLPWKREEITVLVFKATECILHIFKKLCIVGLDLCLAIFHWILEFHGGEFIENLPHVLPDNGPCDLIVTLGSGLLL